MPDFSKALQSLKAADLAYIQQIAGGAIQADKPPSVASRKRRSKSKTPAASMTWKKPRQPAASDQESAPTSPNASEPIISEPDSTNVDMPNAKPPSAISDSGGAMSNPPDGQLPEPDAAGTPLAGKHRTRRAVAHEWPPVGTVLTATYFGTVYRAEIVDAKKRLKSGRQIRLLDGPSKGRRFDSLSKAMLVATAKQRREQKLGRKGASNGWQFWRPTNSAQSASPRIDE